MILCNFALLAGIDPAAVADWFLTFYADSHDWVVLPNVIGMGLNADGGITATKPYIRLRPIIKRMSNFCGSCSYHPISGRVHVACPFNTLYWNFLIEHESTLRANPRLGPAVLGLKRVGDAEREQIRTEARHFLNGIEPYPSARRGCPVTASMSSVPPTKTGFAGQAHDDSTHPCSLLAVRAVVEKQTLSQKKA